MENHVFNTLIFHYVMKKTWLAPTRRHCLRTN